MLGGQRSGRQLDAPWLRDLRLSDYPHWEVWPRQAPAIKPKAFTRSEGLPALLRGFKAP